MAGNALVHTDNSRLSWLDQRLLKIEELMVLISGLAIAALVLLAVVSVAGRLFFAQPLAGYIDWIQQFMPLIAFTGISYALRNGAHIRMDMLIVHVKGRAFYAMELLTTLMICIFAALLIWGGVAHFERSFDWAQPYFSRDSSIDIGLPLWPAKLLVPVSFAVMVLRAILQILCYAIAVIKNPETPIGVPLIPNVEEQAAAEAAQLLGKDD